MKKYLTARWPQLGVFASLAIAYLSGLIDAQTAMMGGLVLSTIGEASAPSQHTINYDALLSTTMFAFRDEMVDNIFRDSAMLAFLRSTDAVVTQDGGERIQMPLMHGKNKTVKSYQGYELIDTTPQEGITSAFYEWREIAGTITISRREERQNSGEARMLGLLQSKLTQAEMTMRETLNEQLLRGTVSGTEFVPGNSAKDLNPLGYFLRKDNTANPASGGNVGNISAAAVNDNGDTFWIHKTAVGDSASTDTGNSFALAITTFNGMKAGARRLYNFCARGSGGPPNLGLADQITYETYVNALQDQQRFQNAQMAELGFENVKLGISTIMWDEVVPDIDNGTVAVTAGTLFFLNTRFYKLIIDSETDIVTTPFIEPENQTAKTAKVLFMGNAGVSSLRKHGVLYAISQTIAA